MKSMILLSSFIAAGLAAGGTYLLTKPEQPAIMAVETNASAANNTEIASLRAELASFRESVISTSTPGELQIKDPDIVDLKNYMTIVMQRLETLTTLIDDKNYPVHTNKPPMSRENLKVSMDESMAEQAQIHQQYLDSQEAQLQNEDVDKNWVAATQEALGNIFQQESLVGSSLTTTDCRSSMCRLEIFHGDEVDATSATEAFLFESIKLFSEGSSTHESTADGREKTTLYVYRSETE